MAKKRSRQKKSTHRSSAKHREQHNRQASRYAGQEVPQPDVEHFMKLYDAKRLVEAEQAAQAMTQHYPQGAIAWKSLGMSQLEGGRAEEALAHLKRSVELDGSDPQSITSLAAVYYQQGDHEQAVRYQERAVELHPQYASAQYYLAEMLQAAGKHVKALAHAKKALELGFDGLRSRVLVGTLLYRNKCFSEALEVYKNLERDYPGSAPIYNNLGMLYKDIGQYELSESYYQKAMEEQPDFVMAYSNLFFSKHYNPNITQQEIVEFAKGWDLNFAFPRLPDPTNLRDTAKPLRVGMISSGFRIHPVGQMIATAIEHSRPDIHFYAYTRSDADDYVTRKICKSTKIWRPVRHLSQEALAQLIRDDGVDILIDLSGHGDGSCLQAISMRPAPLCVKWVGGLVNTMGLSSIDYLISDTIETPEGVDDQYTEKLIRLPDDYICYMPCPYAPDTTSLPALKNRYITLGCLNNPAKISSQLLAEWAKLMHQLPESRLLLRGAQYESEDFRQWVWKEMAKYDIKQYRILLEGPANHRDFIGTYQRIDIALDTWPYSGGITTCEALMMGVPVVTRVGPTFAGRHSATHLVNAGLPELVTDSWEDFRKRAKELANDLPNLALIRAGLRTILYSSPVCDAPRFSNHFNNALRAIWQRHCEGKDPEALTFSKSGAAKFADEDSPVKLASPSEGFDWQLESPVVAVDNGAVLVARPDARELLGSGRVVMLSFDPAGKLSTVDHLAQYGEIQHFPHSGLGDGQPITLRIGEGFEPTTLEPLDSDADLETHEIPTVALDSIEGLPSIDLLALDASHDGIKILQHAEKALQNTLLIQARVAFQPVLRNQPDFARVHAWMELHGFRFYRFINENLRSYFPNSVSEEKRQATELQSADAIFLPSHKRMQEMSRDKKVKLAFIFSTIYGVQDFAYEVLSQQHECAEHLLNKTTKDKKNVSCSNMGRSESGRDGSKYLDREFIFFNYPLIYGVSLFGEGISLSLKKMQLKPKVIEGTRSMLRAVAGSSERAIIFTGHSFYNTTVKSHPYIAEEKNIFDVCDKVPFSIVDDHAYADFMLPRCKNAPREIIVGSTSSNLLDEFEAVASSKIVHKIKVPFKAPEDDPALFEEKEERAVFVGKLYEGVPRSIYEVVNQVNFESRLTSVEKKSINHMIERRRQDPFFSLPARDMGVSDVALLYYDFVDKFFRNYHREKGLAKFVASFRKRKIPVLVIGGEGAAWSFEGKEYCEFVAKMEYRKALSAMRSAKYNINLTPSYPDTLTGRAVDMMGGGSLCVSDYSPFYEKLDKSKIYFDSEFVSSALFEELDHEELAENQKNEVLRFCGKEKVINGWSECFEKAFEIIGS